MHHVKTLMQELGFDADQPEQTVNAFLKNLIKTNTEKKGQHEEVKIALLPVEKQQLDLFEWNKTGTE